jgi:glycosyltransferase involved in cell wall biosynthesis
LTPKKGHEHLLRALALVRERGIACSLVLAGDGAERERLEHLRDELGLAGQVQFLGAVSNVADVLAAVDVFVLPSVIEGLPLALLEAMLAGKAVIATSVGGVPEVVRAGVNGLLVPPASPRELADAVAALSESPEQRALLGAAARDTIERGFTESVYLESLTAVYLELVGSLAR